MSILELRFSFFRICAFCFTGQWNEREEDLVRFIVSFGATEKMFQDMIFTGLTSKREEAFILAFSRALRARISSEQGEALLAGVGISCDEMLSVVDSSVLSNSWDGSSEVKSKLMEASAKISRQLKQSRRNTKSKIADGQSAAKTEITDGQSDTEPEAKPKKPAKKKKRPPSQKIPEKLPEPTVVTLATETATEIVEIPQSASIAT